MDQRTSPLPRIKPLPQDHSPELKEQFEAMRKNLGFIPNSILIMQRKPKLAKALAQMTAAVWDPEGKVDRGFKRIIAHVASRAAGCQYCMAHTAGGALHFGVEDKKLAAVWEYRTNPLYSAAERAPRGGFGAQRGDRRYVCRAAQTLDGRTNCRNRRGDIAVRFPQSLERYHGHAA
jgi:alkylhydroperoxidase family enzyme